ncbi:hypothetical protein Taro_048225 [Colocasia esculenta]|uniref:FH2 domain-containing protein n=1 Tax=Colocasia esculenta TaxID=4460 RepID=A0A843X7A7_COLES|nr:hypothetical protein [Colocasia esculenta]
MGESPIQCQTGLISTRERGGDVGVQFPNRLRERKIILLCFTGNELPTELLQTLLKMSPTADEELKLRLYAGEISHLGPAERFLKALVDIPFAFKRLDALLFMSSLEEEISNVKKDFATIEAKGPHPPEQAVAGVTAAFAKALLRGSSHTASSSAYNGSCRPSQQ